MRLLGIIFWLTYVSASATFAQQSPSTTPDIEPITVFNHPSNGWWWVSGQMNFIFQTI